jgi:hypothetical protein
MTVRELYGWIQEHKAELVASLLDGSYEPQAVLGVEIAKPSGGNANWVSRCFVHTAPPTKVFTIWAAGGPNDPAHLVYNRSVIWANGFSSVGVSACATQQWLPASI